MPLPVARSTPSSTRAATSRASSSARSRRSPTSATTPCLEHLGLRRCLDATDRASPLAELAEPTEEWREALGALKADCEDVVRERFPDAFIPRPGLIVGPWDPTGRFTYWPERIAEGGRVLAPAPRDASFQVIDVRDLAAWIVRPPSRRWRGPQRGRPPDTRGDAFETIRRVTGSDAEFEWVEPDFLAANEVGEWMELPLWLHAAEHAGMLSIDPKAAFEAGLTTRPLEETTRDTLAWVRAGEAPDDPPAGLERAKERQVLDAWLSKQ